MGLFSKKICPELVSKRPNKHFKKTVFPDPLCPIIKLVLPFSKIVDIPLRTGDLSNSLDMFFTFIIYVNKS
jgi:hypothetical protein